MDSEVKQGMVFTKRWWFFLFVIVGLASVLPGFLKAQKASQSTEDPAGFQRLDAASFDSLMRYYPALYRDIESRTADRLWDWVHHHNPEIQKQAWRGLVHAEIEDMYKLDLEVEEANLPVAWFALSHHELNKDLQRILEQRWREREVSRSGIARVLGKQGSRQSLEFLISHLQQVRGTDEEFTVALAVGRLTREYSPSKSDQFKLIKTAFTSGSVQTTRAYLYGVYRSDSTVFDPEVRQNLFRLWQVYGIGREPRIDQYMIKIMGKSYPDVIQQLFAKRDIDSIQVRVGMELAALAGRSKADSSGMMLAQKLLMHPHPQVVSGALNSVRRKSWDEAPIRAIVTDSLLADQDLPDRLWSEVLLTTARLWPRMINTESGNRNLSRLNRLRRDDPYLQPMYLDIVRRTSMARYFSAIDTLLQINQPPGNTFAARNLADFWSEQDPSVRSDSLRQTVRTLMFQALESGDRGTVYEITPLLGDSVLFSVDQFRRLRQSLGAFELPEDIEVYQAMGRVMKQRFPEKAQPLVDSLAGRGYGPLNRSLRSMGWSLDMDKSDSEGKMPEFRRPDWNRLAALGPAPVWSLRTVGDTIRIRLDPVRAPMTVSAIDSLTRAGAYDRVAFHRVVSNFVIQGGDIERGDGFGGPDFTLLTEPSEEHYTRGSVGIASAGTDTEGSQYFIMHQWKPHLNGNYTRFGVVIDGMEEVDRIMEGNRVLEASIRKTPGYR